MKSALSTIMCLFNGQLATAQLLEPRANPQTVHLTFHGGPAQYSLAIPADGKVHPTGNSIAVDIIDAPDYNAISQCTFYASGQKALASGITDKGLQQVIVGPPQPITAVSCYGLCVAVYSDCYDTKGQFVGPCCNGYCAANKCRPWVSPF